MKFQGPQKEFFFFWIQNNHLQQLEGEEYVPELWEALYQFSAGIEELSIQLALDRHICLKLLTAQTSSNLTPILCRSQPNSYLSGEKPRAPLWSSLASLPTSRSAPDLSSFPHKVVWGTWSLNCILSLCLPYIGNRIGGLKDRLWMRNCVAPKLWTWLCTLKKLKSEKWLLLSWVGVAAVSDDFRLMFDRTPVAGAGKSSVGSVSTVCPCVSNPMISSLLKSQLPWLLSVLSFPILKITILGYIYFCYYHILWAPYIWL